MSSRKGVLKPLDSLRVFIRVSYMHTEMSESYCHRYLLYITFYVTFIILCSQYALRTLNIIGIIIT